MKKKKHEPAGSGCGVAPRVREQKATAGITLTFASKRGALCTYKRREVSGNEKKKKKKKIPK